MQSPASSLSYIPYRDAERAHANAEHLPLRSCREHAAITEFKISDSTSVTCDSNEGFWAEVQSWLIPQFAGDIYGAVNAPIEDAINGEFTTLIDDYNLDTCGSS